MRVLLDENLPHDLAAELVGHDVATVHSLGWAGIKNGELLRKAMEKKIDVLIGGLSEDTLVYHEALRAGVLGAVSKFGKSFDIERLSLQVKETKSVFALHFYFDLDGKFQTVSCEGHTIIEALAVLSKHLKALFEKAKSEKMDKKKVEIREVDE